MLLTIELFQKSTLFLFCLYWVDFRESERRKHGYNSPGLLAVIFHCWAGASNFSEGKGGRGFAKGIVLTMVNWRGATLFLLFFI